ncbi:23S rRNA (cytidine2498-2'-O)-methyltransferase [Natronospira proteinivora]|uniref:23S rRNA (Cytidine2498-2'-O)-methyltransferase n=1 Tax=Natronospira proteinivora TaxID=1807133 RepID=A0ABT1GAT5_9GAMM|nr:23S rRNA (cytidine(2498)-2'-O)-methyltransferase RlmM [Natronospira proteinivora]MCP1728020.1 23S rRNA (cytidine2498-2'-O)-methyltransferase [Natronospira proteinivora]
MATVEASLHAPNWLLHCRPGMESATAAEMEERARAQGILGTYAIAQANSAYLRLCQPDPDQARAMVEQAPTGHIFARQLIHEHCWMEGLPQRDRLSPILAALPRHQGFEGIQLSAPDSNEGKALSRFLKGFGRALRQGAEQQGIDLALPGAPRLHLFFPDSNRVSIGFNQDPASPPGGIRRLRMPGQAPSRSTLKLEEALLTLLSEAERNRWLQPGLRAVDLGAAPGGWSWQMVRRHIQVTAVDNGPMAPSLMDSGLVEHVRADGFTWRPPRAVDWLLCDMVDKPGRVAARMQEWLGQSWTRHAVFNLKLPMKRPWPIVRNLLWGLESALAESRPSLELRARQLYHDREEITVLAVDPDGPGARK